MATVTNTAESGLASGTIVTTANSACPDAWTVVTPGAGGSITFDTSHPQSGSLAYAIAPASAVACYLSYSGIAGASAAVATRGYVYFTGYPSTTQAILDIRSPTGSTGVLQVTMSSTGVLALANNVSSTTVGTSTGTLSLNTAYRIEIQMSGGTSTTTGTVTLNVFAGESTTAISNMTITGTGLNLGSGTTTFGTLRIGRTTSAGTLAVAHWDNWSFRTGSSAALGPYVTPTAPTAAFTVAVASLTATVDGSTSAIGTAGTTITGYDWDWGDTTTHGTGVTPAAHVYAAGTYTITLTVTDSNGLTNQATQSVVASAALQDQVVSAIGSGGSGWVGSPTGTDPLVAITDGDATNFILSPGASGTFPVSFGPCVVGAAGQPVTVTIAVDMTGATTGTVSAKLLQGATILNTQAAQSLTNVTVGTPMTHTLTFTFPWTGGAASITDWTQLGAQFLWSAS